MTLDVAVPLPWERVVDGYDDSANWYGGKVGIPVGAKPPGNRWLKAAS